MRKLSLLTASSCAALMLSCGGDGGERSAPGSTPGGATPSAGYLVDQHVERGQLSLNIYRADDVGGAPLSSIPDGWVFPEHVIDGVGLMYCRSPDSLGCMEVGLITSPGAQRVITAAPEAGHLFEFLSETSVSERFLVIDVMGETSYGILSFAKDGSDRRILKSGCTTVDDRYRHKTAPTGVLFSCNTGAGSTLWCSDGLSEAKELPGTLNANPRRTDGAFALYVNSAGRLTSRRTDGTGDALQLSPDTSGMDTLLASVDSIALVTTQSPTGTYDTWTIPFAGRLFFHPSLNHAGPTVMGNPRVTLDHRHFVVVYDGGTTTSKAFLVPVDAGDNDFVNLTPAGTSVASVALFDDGTTLVREMGGPFGSGWQVVHGTTDGTPAIAGPMLDGNALDTLWGTLGKWAIFQDSAAPYALRAASKDGLAKTTLTAMGTNLSVDPVLLPSGRILFVDSDLTPWIATPDLSVKVHLDSRPIKRLRGQTIPEGDRDLIALRHLDGDYDTLIFDAAAQTIIPVLAGASSDSAYFIR